MNPLTKEQRDLIFWGNGVIFCGESAVYAQKFVAHPKRTIFDLMLHFWSENFIKNFCRASNNQMSGIVWNAFWQSFAPIWAYCQLVNVIHANSLAVIHFFSFFCLRPAAGSASAGSGAQLAKAGAPDFGRNGGPQPWPIDFWNLKTSWKPGENLAKTSWKPGENLAKTSRKPRENLAKSR